MALTLCAIEGLFEQHGHIEYAGEGVSQLEHALHAAQRAEKAGASPEQVTAAFLHDLGHLLNLQGDTPSARGIDDQHQYFAIPFLRGLFPAAVIEPIRLHVDAKRALCAAEPDYYERLSKDSKRSLALQGGIFGPDELAAFRARPHAEDAMQVRRWDDGAKVRGALAPSLSHFLEIAARCAV